MALAACLHCAAAALVLVSVANAALVNLGPGSFTPSAAKITFSELGRAIGQRDPVYVLGSNTVSFGEYFTGQSVVGGFPRTLSGTPSSPLTLEKNTNTAIVNDGANPTSPVLSGTPIFNGPISISFSTPVAAVGLSGGYFNALQSTSIEAYDINGNSLGIVANSRLGIEFYGLFDDTGSNIAGVSFYITGNEPAGFAIDEVTFGDASVVISPPPPPPTPPPPPPIPSICPSTCGGAQAAGMVLVSAYNLTVPSIDSVQCCADTCKRLKCAWTYFTFYTSTAGTPTCTCHRQCCDGQFQGGLGSNVMHGAYPSCVQVCRAPSTK